MEYSTIDRDDKNNLDKVMQCEHKCIECGVDWHKSKDNIKKQTIYPEKVRHYKTVDTANLWYTIINGGDQNGRILVEIFWITTKADARDFLEVDRIWQGSKQRKNINSAHHLYVHANLTLRWWNFENKYLYIMN